MINIRKEITVELDKRHIKYLNPDNTQDFFDDLEKTTQVLKKFLRYDSRCIDIGTRDGDSLLPLFSLLSPDHSKITCFEPNPDENKYIEQNAKLNYFDVNVYKYGISDKTGDTYFCFDEKGRNGGIFTQEILIGRWDSKKILPCKHPIDFEDSVKQDLAFCNFIKIDTEGYDMNIINLIWSYIDRPIFMIEWWIGTEQAIADFVLDKNYSVYNPDRKEILKSFDRRKRCDNLILIPSEELDLYNI